MKKETRKLSNRKVLFATILISLLFLPLSARANVSAVNFTTAQVTGGTDSRGVVTLVANAPLGGLKVTLTSNNPAATFPAAGIEPAGATTTVTVPAGKNSAQFTVKTSALAQDTPITITAGSKDASVNGTFTILAPVLKSVSAPASIIGGEKGLGKVILSGPAPKDGVTISLTSSNSAKAKTPAQVKIISGQNSGSFDITSEKLIGEDAQTTIEATSAGGIKVSAALAITLPLIPEIISLTANSSVASMEQISVNFTVDRNIPNSLTIQMTSSNPTIVPAQSFGLGFSGSNTFRNFFATRAVSSDSPVTLTFVSGASSKSITFTVRPIKIDTLNISGSTITGGSSTTGTIALNLPRTSDTFILLSSNNPGVTVPNTIKIPATSDGIASPVTFEVFSQSVPNSRFVMITARLQSPLIDSKFFNLNVVPISIESLVLSQSRCDLMIGRCRDNLRGIVTLNAPAPPEGMSVSLSVFNANSYSPTVPNIVLIPSGQNTAQFQITVPTGSMVSGVRTIRAVSGSNVSATADLELVTTLVDVESITLNSIEVEGGKSVTGTVTVKQFTRLGSIETPNPTTSFPSQVEFSINSSPDFTRVGTFEPSRLFIPAGQTTGDFTFSTKPVGSEATFQIGAASPSIIGGGGQRLATPIMIKPPTIQSFTLSDSNVQGGQEVIGTIQMSGPTPSGVTLTSSDPSIITSILGGANSGNSISYKLVTSAAVTSPTTVTITAALGNQTKTVELTVNRVSQLSSISLPDPRIFARVDTSLKLELDGPAPKGGAKLLLSSSNGQLIGLNFSEATIPEGQQSTTYRFSSSQPKDPTPIQISATYKNQTKQVSVTVENLTVEMCQDLQFKGGQQFECTLKIVNPGMVAPDGGLQFNVTTDKPNIISLPSSLFIPTGQNSVSFQITTQPVTQITRVQIDAVNISASGGSISRLINPQ